jgi:IMP dehydrogenase
VRLELLRPSLDARGALMVAAAVGISTQAAEIAAQLLDIGVSAIVLDTAHRHQRRMLEAIVASQARRPRPCPDRRRQRVHADGTRARWSMPARTS